MSHLQQAPFKEMSYGPTSGGMRVWPVVCCAAGAFLGGCGAASCCLWWYYSPFLEGKQDQLEVLVDSQLAASDKIAGQLMHHIKTLRKEALAREMPHLQDVAVQGEHSAKAPGQTQLSGSVAHDEKGNRTLTAGSSNFASDKVESPSMNAGDFGPEASKFKGLYEQAQAELDRWKSEAAASTDQISAMHVELTHWKTLNLEAEAEMEKWKTSAMTAGIAMEKAALLGEKGAVDEFLKLKGYSDGLDPAAFQNLMAHPGKVWRDKADALQKKVEELTEQANATKQMLASCALGSVGGTWQKQKDQQLRAATARSWAYVTIAHDESGNSHMARALALANALQRLSAYPLVLLTNKSHFVDGTRVAEGLRHLNVQVLPVHAVPWSGAQGLAHWKLQAWNLTQFDRLIWLDTDSIVYRPLDWLFERTGIWAQRNDEACNHSTDTVSSGIMLLRPNVSDYKGLLQLASTTGNTLFPDQALISEYFAKSRGTPINLLGPVEASFGRCLGSARSPYINPDGSEVRGSWSTPAFVHRSGGWGPANNAYQNVCFSHELSRQRYYVGASVLNSCQYNPLAAFWRILFCDAVASLGISGIKDFDAFCSDVCYYSGQGALCGGPAPQVLNATLSPHDYASRTRGMPELELELQRRTVELALSRMHTSAV